MALLFNSFNALFIGRLMLLIYFLLKQIKTICADTGLDFWHGPERSAFNFIFIDYTDNIICIKNCSLNPCHFTTRVRGSHHGAGFSLPISSFPFCFPLHPSLFSLFLLHCWMPFRFFLWCFYAFCDICSSTTSLPLSPSRFSLLLFHFFPPLHRHCICLPGSTAITPKVKLLDLVSLVILRAFSVRVGLWIREEAGTGLLTPSNFEFWQWEALPFFETAFGWFLCLNCSFLKPQAPALPPAVATVMTTAKPLSSVETSLSQVSSSCVYPAEVTRSDGTYCLVLDRNNQMVWEMKPGSSGEAVLGTTLACRPPAIHLGPMS